MHLLLSLSWHLLSPLPLFASNFGGLAHPIQPLICGAVILLPCVDPSLISDQTKMHQAMWLQVLLLVVVNCVSASASAFNITTILDKFGDFSNFNRLLSETHVADEINSKRSITILALDDASIQYLTSNNLPLREVGDILRYHVLLQYFGMNQIQSLTNGTTLATTLYQSTGRAAGNLGSVNVTDEKAGTVGIGDPKPASNLTATVLKSLVEIPYNISVLQISNVILPIGIGAPTPSPVPVPAPAPASTPSPTPVSAPEPSAPGSALSPKTPSTVVGAPGSTGGESNEAAHVGGFHVLFASVVIMGGWLLVI